MQLLSDFIPSKLVFILLCKQMGLVGHRAFILDS